jgi:hypothetical protein
VKFFLFTEDFQSQRRLISDSPLSAFLPEAEAHDGNTWQDTESHALPPCIVMERGESLAEWLQAEKPDASKCVAVRSQKLISNAFQLGPNTVSYSRSTLQPAWQCGMLLSLGHVPGMLLTCTLQTLSKHTFEVHFRCRTFQNIYS